MKHPELSVIIPVGSRVDDLSELHPSYEQGLDSSGLSYEIVYVLDGTRRTARQQLTELKDKGASIKIVQLGKGFGEATALMAGFTNTRGQRILTLPAYFQIEGAEIPKLLEAGEQFDMVVARRWPRRGSWFERVRRGTFHRLLRLITGETFRDLGCNVRVLDRPVIEEIAIYGEQHRLLPVLASRQGFRVQEIDVTQSPRDQFLGRYRIREYLHRLLDILTVFFLVRFTRKPLRFFGMIGSVTFGIGALAIAVLVGERLFFDQPLADRPALLLSSLLIVLGTQLFALGLLGELIIFTHAKDLKEYKVREIVEADAHDGDRMQVSSGEVHDLTGS